VADGIGRDVHPAVAWHPGQAVDVVDEPVERRGGHPPIYSMVSVWPTGVQFATEVTVDHVITAADPPDDLRTGLTKISCVRRGAH